VQKSGIPKKRPFFRGMMMMMTTTMMMTTREKKMKKTKIDRETRTCPKAT
jgi:hypothetical protein